MCNFAPPDMVGHTGKYEEAILACEATDKAIGVIYEACKRSNTILFGNIHHYFFLTNLVTADHGNAEKMINLETGEPHTAHTTGKVPFMMASNDFEFHGIEDAALCDVAPTLLEAMGVSIPSEMTGRSLIKK